MWLEKLSHIPVDDYDWPVASQWLFSLLLVSTVLSACLWPWLVDCMTQMREVVIPEWTQTFLHVSVLSLAFIKLCILALIGESCLRVCGFDWFAGAASQIQCYQCEEMMHNDCSSPEYIVNCTVNVQDTCQGEVLVKEDGKKHRPASSFYLVGCSRHLYEAFWRRMVRTPPSFLFLSCGMFKASLWSHLAPKTCSRVVPQKQSFVATMVTMREIDCHIKQHSQNGSVILQQINNCTHICLKQWDGTDDSLEGH